MEGGPTQAWAPRNGDDPGLKVPDGGEDSMSTGRPSSDVNAIFAANLRETATGGPDRGSLTVTDRGSTGGRPSLISSDPGSRSAGVEPGVTTSPSSSSVLHSFRKAPKTNSERIQDSCKVIWHAIGRGCSCIAENKVFVFVGTFITVWALLGDDLKLLTTDRPVDDIFDGLVVFCIVFFFLGGCDLQFRQR